MKRYKIILSLLVFAILLLIPKNSIFAEDSIRDESENSYFYFVVTNEEKKTAIISGYDVSAYGAADLITIPETVMYTNSEQEQVTYYITGISSGAFAWDGVHGVTCKDNVETIGTGAFKGNTTLEGFYATNIDKIPSDCFNGCTFLSYINFSKPLKSIGDRAFKNCSRLGDFTLMSTVTSFGDNVFEGAFSSIRTIEVTVDCKVGAKTFYKSNVTDLIVDTSGDISEESIFEGCSRLEQVTYRSTVAAPIGSRCFYECYDLDTFGVDGASGITGIGDYAFGYCTSLKDVSWKNTIKSIGDFAFTYTTSLSSPHVGQTGVESIGDYAYYYSGITSINFPSNLTKIGEATFAYCTKLSGTLKFPDKLRVIPNYAFYNCSSLTGIEFNKVQSLGNYSLGECRKLYPVTIPMTVHTNKQAFASLYSYSKLSDTYGKGVITCKSAKAWYDLFMDTNPNDINCVKDLEEADRDEEKATFNKAGYLRYICKNCGRVIQHDKFPKVKKSFSYKKSMVYTGSPIKLDLTIKDNKNKILIENTDYTVTYKYNTNVGTATAIVALDGHYEGTISVTFKIVPKAISIKKTKNLETGFKVWWKNGGDIPTGYQIQYCTTRNFKDDNPVTISIARTKGMSYNRKITGLIERKSYYVRVRCYTRVNRINYYSDWSKVKRVRTLKKG